MSGHYRTKETRIRLALLAGFAAASPFALPSSVFAQPIDTSYSDNLPSGSFIISRPVPMRSAEVPPTIPAPPASVVLGGKDDTLRAVSIGLTPLTDAEQSSVTGNVGQGFSGNPAMGGPTVDGNGDRQSFQMGDMLKQRSDGATGTIRQALGSIPSAMSALRNALGAER